MDNEKPVVEVELNGEDKVEDTPMVVVPSASNDILKAQKMWRMLQRESGQLLFTMNGYHRL